MVLETGISLNELYAAGLHKQLSSSINSLSSLKTTVQRFLNRNPELVKKHIIKRYQAKGRPKNCIADLSSFIVDYNKFSDKDGDTKIRRDYISFYWSPTSIDCYERGCECRGCFYNSFRSLHNRCKMEQTVVELLKLFGEPIIDS